MSGVYVVEIVPRDSSKSKILKIGRSSGPLEKRIEEMFHNKYDRNQYSYYIIEQITAHPSVAVSLENYLINTVIWDYKIEPKDSREYFEVNDEIIKSFTAKINHKVLEFYDGFKMHSALELSIAGQIKSKRKVMNLTQTGLAKSIGLRQATISELENGHIGNYKTLLKVLEVLGLRLLVSPV